MNIVLQDYRSKVIEAGRCEPNCPFLVCWSERHPYGSTTATETLRDCEADYDADCPVACKDAEDRRLDCPECEGAGCVECDGPGHRGA
jgi:hypothetical protein